MSQQEPETMAGYITDLGNEISFSLRKTLYKHLFSHLPQQYAEQSEDKTVLIEGGRTFKEIAWLKSAYRLNDRLQDLQKHYQSKYPLDSLYKRSTCLRWLENLTILDCLNQVWDAQPFLSYANCKSISWLDVGSKNWAYVDAIWAFLTTHTEEEICLSLEGIELDPYRRYVDGFHRLDYAQHFVNKLPTLPTVNVRYQPGNVLSWQGVGNAVGKRYNIISWFLPFIFEDPLISWGLPKRHFEPEKALRHVIGLLEDDGYLLVVNQTEEEYNEQQRLFGIINRPSGITPPWHLQVQPLGALPESFLPYRHTRYATVCQKQAAGGI